MINIRKALPVCLMLLAMVSCNDFYEPENKTAKPGDSYMKENGELYSGFLGLVTKLQTAGDKAILLTDTRGDLLEPANYSEEILAIYNYSDDLRGNRYADPAKYYDIIIACNDFMAKAREYNNNHSASVNQDHYKGLIGGALRLKVWTYFMLGKIYGQAVWFDDPLVDLKSYTDFPMLTLDEIIPACVYLLESGYDGAKGSDEMSWVEWLSENSAVDMEGENSTDSYTYWDMMVPPYFVLAAELALWENRFEDVVNLILPKMNEAFTNAPTSSNSIKWLCNASYNNGYSDVFNKRSDRSVSSIYPVSLILYDFEKNQTNELLKHFSYDYLLKASDKAIDRYSDTEFNPLNEDQTDNRLGHYFRQNSDNEWYIYKYRTYGTLRGDVQIYIYRSVELYLMLAEAFNHLGRYQELDAILNVGVNYYYQNILDRTIFDGFSINWTNGGRHSYTDLGTRGVRGLPARTIEDWGDPEDIRYNDMQILRETLLELAAEGKSYAAMLRMARRYEDYSIIADLVCPKYEDPALQDEIRDKIVTRQGYFVHWDMSWESAISL